MGRRAVAGTVLWIVVLLGSACGLAAAESGPGEEKTCAACHAAVFQLLEQEGGKHLGAVACVDCHLAPPHEAPPSAPAEGCPVRGGELAPCTGCHRPDTAAHFSAPDCASCHQPHAPTQIDYQEVFAKPVCLTCHPEQGAELEAAPSRHTKLNCTACHRTHATSFACRNCHAPHAEGMTDEDCLGCHRPHAPTAIAYRRPLAPSLCAGCHPRAVDKVGAQGARHGTAVTCIDCHADHGPNRIPKCSQCHAPKKKDHFKVSGCISCHEPHAPLALDLGRVKEARAACISCHQEQDRQMSEHASAHAEVDCSLCHPRHGEFLACDNCHEPHREEMTYETCLICHPPHQPLLIAFGGAPPAAACAACHAEAVAEIAARGAKHGSAVGCTDCHRDHGPNRIPSCAMCHGAEQNEHFAVSGCTSCHRPHAPLDLRLKEVEAVKTACISCHPEQGRLMEEHPGAHARVDCNVCHAVHGEFLKCTKCHAPHAEELAYETCLQCHPPHMPAVITYEPVTYASLCAVCHAGPVQTVETQGGRHKTAVGCTDCHRDHGPNRIPDCAMCHSPRQKDHFAVADCLACHPPHAPLALNFFSGKPAKPACASCHPEQLVEMAKHPSAHAEADCILCHAEHGSYSDCLACHRPHAGEMLYEECRSCHLPHTPLQVAFAAETPASVCGWCHEKELAALAGSKMKHQALACIACHPGEHKTIEACAGCHGQAHNAALHEKFPDCLTCHLDPHDLPELGAIK